MFVSIFLLFFICGVVSAQTGTLTPRDLFYQPRPSVPPSNKLRSTAAASQEDPLAVRYSILKHEERGIFSVDPDTAFQAEDCFSLEVESKRSGYIYIGTLGTSGTWKLLFPTAEEEAPSKPTPGRTLVNVPSTCWEFHPPPGQERLFLFVTEKVEQAEKLLSIVRQATKRPHGQLSASLGSRDLVQQKSNPKTKDGVERSHSVFAVARQPNLFIEIKVNHKGEQD